MNKQFLNAARFSAVIGVIALWPWPTFAQQTAKACEEQWTTNKASIQASGKKKKDFMSECRSAKPTAVTPTKPTPAPAAVAPAKPASAAAAPAKPVVTPVAKPAATPGPGTPAGANQFSSEAAAKLRCPTDTVVWANLGTKVYHFSGNKDYGNTKRGAYMCEKDTAVEGFRAAKNEKHP